MSDLTPSPIDPGVHIGHVHLKVANLERALDLSDPDGNGVELYCDRPQELWPDGNVAMYTRRLDLENLLAEAPE